MNQYITAASPTVLLASEPAGTTSAPEVQNIRTTLFRLFELDPGLGVPPYTAGFNLAKRLARVSNILQALRDLSQLRADSLPSGSLQVLLDKLKA